MHKKADKKSSIKVLPDQLPDLKRKLRVKDVLDLGRITILLFKELKKLASYRWTCGIVLCNSDNSDTLGLTDIGLLPRSTVSSRQDKFHQAMHRAWKSKKIRQQLDAESHIQTSKPINT